MKRQFTKPIHTTSLMLAIMSNGMLASDMYLPSLPQIANKLHTSSTLVQLTIAFYLLGIAVMQLVYGPLSDKIGRRKVMLIGLSVSVIGSIICWSSTSITVLTLGRILQGAGSAAGLACYRAVLKDLYSGVKFAKMASIGSIFFSVTPAVAPIAGGYITEFLSWRYNFAILTLVALTFLILVWLFLPETNKKLDKEATKIKVLLKNSADILKNPIFTCSSLCASLMFSGIIAYSTAAPFLFIQTLKMSPVNFGWLTLYIAVISILSKLLNVHLLNRIKINTIISVGIVIMFFASLAMVIPGLFGYMTILIVLIPMLIYIFADGIVVTNSSTRAYSQVKQSIGTASSIKGSLNMLVCFIASSIVSLLHEKTQVPLATLLLTLSFLCYFVFHLPGWFFNAKDQGPANN